MNASASGVRRLIILIRDNFARLTHTHGTNGVTSLEGYTKPSSTSALQTTDTLNAALGKLERGVEGKQAAGSYATASHIHTEYFPKTGGTVQGDLKCTGHIILQSGIEIY